MVEDQLLIGDGVCPPTLQTWDLGMRLNFAKFQLNGGCGYVLKPPLIEKPSLAPPETPSPDEQDRPRMLKLRILSAHNLPKTRAWHGQNEWLCRRASTSDRPDLPWPRSCHLFAAS